MQNNEKKTSPFYPLAKWFVWLFFKKMDVVGIENLPSSPSLIIGNHAQMNGPIAAELYLPKNRYTWCAWEMMHLKEVPSYAYRDFWSDKPKWTKPFYKLASYLIAPISSFVFNNANTIPVYHDARVMHTFKDTVKLLQGGNHIVIFPEQAKPHNNIVCDFQSGFTDIARLYSKRTKNELYFVPMYVAPALRKIYIGNPTKFDSKADYTQESERIRNYLMNEITSIAVNLPRHKVVPYSNISRKQYPYNKREG